MSNHYQQIINLVKEISGQKGTIGIPRIYVKITKDLQAGAFLSQVVYWSDKGSRADGYFWKSAKEWQDELELSYAQVTRLARQLERTELIETKLMKANNAPTMHYRPKMENIINLILEFLENRENRNSTSSNVDFRESANSIDFQDSAKSITNSEITINNNVLAHSDKSNHPDPLADILAFSGKTNTVTEPNPDDQWLSYRNKAIDIFDKAAGAWARTSQARETQRNAILGGVADRPDFDPDRWQRSIEQSIARNVAAGNIARFWEVYDCGGDYDLYLAKKYPASSQNGHEQPAVKVVNQRTSDGGIYV